MAESPFLCTLWTNLADANYFAAIEIIPRFKKNLSLCKINSLIMFSSYLEVQLGRSRLG